MKIQKIGIVAFILLCTLITAGRAKIDISIDPEITIEKPDSNFVVCLDVQNVTPEMAISSVQFTLTFDTCVVFWDSTMTFANTCLDSAGWHIQVHNENYTDLEVWIMGGQILDCNGCILRIGFLLSTHCVQACGGDSTFLHFENVVINEGVPETIPHDGLVIVNRGPYFTSPEDGSEFHVKEGPDEGCDTLCYTITAEDPDGDDLRILWLANDSTIANGAVLDSLEPGTWRFCWAPPKRVGNSLAGACYPDTFVVYSTCGAGGIASTSCCFDTIIVSSCVDSLHLHAFWPDTTNFHACGQVEIPVYLETNYGFCFEDLDIYSIYLELRYDTAYLDVFEVGNEGLITENMGPLTYSIDENSGIVRVIMAFNWELSGCSMPAPVLYVGFEISGGTEVSTNLELGIDHVKINEAYPRVCWEGGVINVVNFSIEGDVFYSDNGEPIPDAEVKIWVDDATMTPPADDTVYTDAAGHYGITSILGCSDYCIKVQMDPLDMPDPTQVITSMDAAYILMHIAGTRAFSHNDSLAADVTQDGTISGYDVARLLQEIVGYDTGLPVGEWLFEPAYRCYANLSASRTGEDYEGVIIGDVTQNWPNTGAPKSGIVVGPDVITEENWAVEEEEEEFFFTFPIAFDDVDGIIAAEFRLTYDQEILTAVKVSTTLLSSAFHLEYKTEPGEIRIAMAGASPMSGSGAIAEVLFKTTSGETDLKMYVKINEHTIIILPFPIKIVVGNAPSKYALCPNYPNPFNPSTTIHYTIPSTGHRVKSEGMGTVSELSALRTTLTIYNVLGQEVRTLVDKDQEAGHYSVTWDGKDDTGHEVGSGVYFYRLNVGDYTATKRMVLMK